MPDRAVGFGRVLQAVEAHCKMDVPIPPGPPFFRFSDAAESSRALRDAGFSDPQVRENGRRTREDSRSGVAKRHPLSGGRRTSSTHALRPGFSNKTLIG